MDKNTCKNRYFNLDLFRSVRKHPSFENFRKRKSFTCGENKFSISIYYPKLARPLLAKHETPVPTQYQLCLEPPKLLPISITAAGFSVLAYNFPNYTDSTPSW